MCIAARLRNSNRCYPGCRTHNAVSMSIELIGIATVEQFPKS
jgi:hypothetical protein